MTARHRQRVTEPAADFGPAEPIAFVDLKAQQRRLRAKIEARLTAVLDHGRYVDGPEIEELEEALRMRTGAADVVAVSSGTDALVMALMAEGIGPGDAVFVPAFTYNATANAVLLAGATPVFVDVDPRTFNIDPADLEARIAETKTAAKAKPRALIAVDLFGRPADYPALGETAEAHDLNLIADAAQSFGASQNGRPVGTLAPITTTSFFPAKTLGAYGDGGAIFTDSKEQGEIFRSLRWHGTDDARKESVRIGLNGRLDTMQAAILLTKLEIFDEELAARRTIAAHYDARLRPLLDLPARPEATESAWGLYSITVEDRERIERALADAGIPSAVYYRQPLHRMRAFARYAPENGLPISDWLSAHILSLPIHPYLTERQVEWICDTLEQAL